jgi:hypothetical protein
MMMATTEPHGSMADCHQRQQALTAVSYEMKKASDVKVDYHATKAKYCHYTVL